MYETLGELWHGFSKNAFAGADHSVWVVARNSVLNLLATVLPTVVAVAALAAWLGLGAAAARPVALSAVAAYAAMVLTFVPVYRGVGASLWLAPLAGIANVVMVAILINSTYRALSGRGVLWRGQEVKTGPTNRTNVHEIS
jgi:hypothetical protein